MLLKLTVLGYRLPWQGSQDSKSRKQLVSEDKNNEFINASAMLFSHTYHPGPTHH